MSRINHLMAELCPNGAAFKPIGENEGIIEKTTRIQQDHVQILERDLAFITRKKAEELERIIADECLNPEETRAFVDNAFRDGAIASAGTAITRILPPVSRFSEDNAHALKKQTVLDRPGAFFERYFGLA